MDVTKRALLVCYYFPPLGLGGVGRPLNLFRELPSFGWDCHVLTVKPVAYRGYEPELLEGLDKNKIHRAGSYDPQRLLYCLGVRKMSARSIERGRAVSDRFFPDNKVGWMRPAVRFGRTLCENYDYDAIISTSPPVSSHLVGMQLAREFGIPWVADYRDFWTVYRIKQAYKTEAFKKRARQVRDDICAGASAITAVSKAIADYHKTSHVLPNGYNAQLAEGWKAPPNNERFTIGILGHQYDKHEPTLLLDALDELLRHDEHLNDKVQVIQVGDVDETWFRGMFERRGLNIPVTCYGRRERGETIKLLAQAHLFYLDVAEYDREGFLPSRIFDLLASGRPIFANADADGELGLLLKEYGNGRCFTAKDVAGAGEYVKSLIESCRSDNFVFSPLSDFARRYSSTALAERFASLLNQLPERKR